MSEPQRVAIVTGGGTGIGAAIARRLAGAGTAVALVGRRRGPCEDVAGEIAASGGLAQAIDADMGDPSVPQALVDEVL
ncbi:MAG TPA: SDR family NAD(P)-dependent oxidoreductase, partial [Candidatus Dormibacteraeota bacterium]|nr:SDR family NAD(P)-dependent oxidoreductase [Candidatus Dormibacteraeota bacterium]